MAFAQNCANLRVTGGAEQAQAEVVAAGDFGGRTGRLGVQAPKREIIVAGFVKLQFGLQGIARDAIANRQRVGNSQLVEGGGGQFADLGKGFRDRAAGNDVGFGEPNIKQRPLPHEEQVFEWLKSDADIADFFVQ